MPTLSQEAGLTGRREGKCDEKMQHGRAHHRLSCSTVCQHRQMPSTIYSITTESLKWAARQPTGFRALPLWLPRKRAYNGSALFQVLDPPTLIHSSYLPRRGPHNGQFLATPPMEPSDGIRAYGAHSGSNQTEIDSMDGWDSAVHTVQKTWHPGA